MPRRYSSRLPVPDKAAPRWVIPLILTAGGFAGGLAIAVFYNAALSPVPPDSIQAASKITMAGPYPAAAEPARSYPSVGQVFHARTTDGRGGDAVDSPQARARARATRLELIRIDKIMQICTGC
jgi:hypothetical protein